MADPDSNLDPPEAVQTCPDPTPLERIVQILNSMVEDVTQNLAKNNQGLLLFVSLQLTFLGTHQHLTRYRLLCMYCVAKFGPLQQELGLKGAAPPNRRIGNIGPEG